MEMLHFVASCSIHEKANQPVERIVKIEIQPLAHDSVTFKAAVGNSITYHSTSSNELTVPAEDLFL